MTDDTLKIVERLRERKFYRHHEGGYDPDELCHEAADIIEALADALDYVHPYFEEIKYPDEYEEGALQVIQNALAKARGEE